MSRTLLAQRKFRAFSQVLTAWGSERSRDRGINHLPGRRHFPRRDVPPGHADHRPGAVELPSVGRFARSVSDSPGHSVASLSLHMIGTTWLSPSRRQRPRRRAAADVGAEEERRGGLVEIFVSVTSVSVSLPSPCAGRVRRSHADGGGGERPELGEVAVPGHGRLWVAPRLRQLTTSCWVESQ